MSRIPTPISIEAAPAAGPSTAVAGGLRPGAQPERRPSQAFTMTSHGELALYGEKERDQPRSKPDRSRPRYDPHESCCVECVRENAKDRQLKRYLW
jgi:hypothetical protein